MRRNERSRVGETLTITATPQNSQSTLFFPNVEPSEPFPAKRRRRLKLCGGTTGKYESGKESEGRRGRGERQGHELMRSFPACRCQAEISVGGCIHASYAFNRTREKIKRRLRSLWCRVYICFTVCVTELKPRFTRCAFQPPRRNISGHDRNVDTQL